MNIRAVFAVALLATSVSIGMAYAQDRPEQYAAALKTNCAKELRSQCKGVVEGQGRLLACLYAHENKLSAKCSTTVDGSLERLGAMLGA
jgi:hypothetical protein